MEPTGRDDRDAELGRQAVRLYRRYEVEVVQAFGLCPWAERARQEGRVHERVVPSPAPEPPAVAKVVRELADDARVHIGLMLFPRFDVDRIGFERFVGEVRRCIDSRRDASPGPRPDAALAAFHPDAEADLASAERLVPFVRRTPDPTIQLVRQSVLDRLRESRPHGTGLVDLDTVDLDAFMAQPDPGPPLHERVAEHNLETVEREGVARLETVFEAIRADRQHAYADLI
ncbi:MAG: DUF1415 family protein [Polyangiales bacterium]